MGENLKMTQKTTEFQQECLGQRKWWKLKDSFEEKAWPRLQQAGSSVFATGRTAGKRIARAKINWLAILAIVVLVYMAQNGMMDSMPELKWLIESTVRLIEWAIGLVHKFFRWGLNLPMPKLGVFEMLNEWLRAMFAL